MPLHYAARHSESETVVQALLDAYPDAVKERSNVRDRPHALLTCPLIITRAGSCSLPPARCGSPPVALTSLRRVSENIPFSAGWTPHSACAAWQIAARDGRGERIWCDLHPVALRRRGEGCGPEPSPKEVIATTAPASVSVLVGVGDLWFVSRSRPSVWLAIY